MIIDPRLPPWVEALRNVEEQRPYGPPLGPALASILEDSFRNRFDFMAFLWNLLCDVYNRPIPDAIGVGLPYTAKFIPGHTGFKPIARDANRGTAAQAFPRGPRPGCAKVVVVGKHPGRTEYDTDYLFVGESGRELQRCLIEQGIADFLDDAYFTNICRFQPPPGGKFKQAWVKECAWLLWAELVIIRPKLVILLGTEAIKHFHGRGSSVTKSRGSVRLWTTHLPRQCDSSGQEPEECDIAGQVPEEIVINTFPTMHPAAVAREPNMRDGLSNDLARASSFACGTIRKQIPREYQDVDGQVNNACVLRSVHQVREYVDQRLQESENKLALDCEWSGRSPWADGKLLTLQLSYKSGHAVLIPFHRHARVPFPRHYASVNGHPNLISFPKPTVSQALAYDMEYVDDDGQPALGYVWTDAAGNKVPEMGVEVLNALVPNFTDAEMAEVSKELARLLLHPGTRIGGHNLRADYPWVKSLGIDFIDKYADGFDTMLKHHLLYESAKQDLSSLMLKYTDVDRYETELQGWLDELAVPAAKGFGLIPEHVLYLYALFDADVTWRCDERLDERYAEQDNMCHEDRAKLAELLSEEMRSCVGILEIEETGLLADRDRITELAITYDRKKTELLDYLRKQIEWPAFNFRSIQHVRELLFGEAFNGKKRDTPLVPIRLRPAGAYCCGLTPIKSTDKPPIDWDRVLRDRRQLECAPSTDKETLGILSPEDPVANQLRKLRFVDQVCKNFTSLPVIDPDTHEITEGGLMQHVDPDGRVRTHILQILETGRWASRKPNLQNLPKRREPELHAMFAKWEQAPPKIRSIFMAQPGYVLVEADYCQAELIVLALLSGDLQFWNVLTERPPYPVLVDALGEPYRWLHPDWVRDIAVREGDEIPSGTRYGEYKDRAGQWHVFSTAVDTTVKMIPWKRDLHAERAISGFKLPYCAVMHGPPKGYVESIGKDKRVAAKTVNFGIPYGRSAGAIARELKQEGVEVTTDDCQAMINSFHSEFVEVSRFLDLCRQAVHSPGYLINPCWRYRRFHTVDDSSVMSQQEREACNFPIQSTVAECLNKAVYNCRDAREQYRVQRNYSLDFRIALGVHDALIFEVAVGSIDLMMRTNCLIDWCMSNLARIPLPPKGVCNGLYDLVDDSKFANGGYAIDVDKELFLRWDEKPDPKKEPEAAAELRAKLEKMGVPEPYLPRTA